jgi:hypothetical protein
LNADAKLYAFVRRYGGVFLDHAALDFKGASRCVHRTRKFNQKTIACCFDDPTAMLFDFEINEGLSDSLELSKRFFLINAHETAIPDDICRQYRCQSPFQALGAQGAAQLSRP